VSTFKLLAELFKLLAELLILLGMPPLIEIFLGRSRFLAAVAVVLGFLVAGSMMLGVYEFSEKMFKASPVATVIALSMIAILGFKYGPRTVNSESLPRTQQLLKAIIGLRINLQALPTRWVVAMGIALLLLGGVGTLLVTREGEAPTSRLDVDEDQKPASASPPQVQFNPPQGARQGEPPRQAPRLPSETAEPRGNEELRNAARDSPPARPSEQPSAPVVSSPTAAPTTRPSRVDQTDESTQARIRQRAEWKNRIDQAVLFDRDIKLRSLSRTEARRLDDSGKATGPITFNPCADAQFVTHKSWEIWKKTQYPIVSPDSFVISSSQNGYALAKRTDFAPYDDQRSRPPVLCFSDGSLQFENLRTE